MSVTDPFIIPIIFLSGREMAHDNKMKINLVVNYESKPVKSNVITLSHDYIKRLRRNSGGQADDNINQLHFAIGRRRYCKPQFCAIEL